MSIGLALFVAAFWIPLAIMLIFAFKELESIGHITNYVNEANCTIGNEFGCFSSKVVECVDTGVIICKESTARMCYYNVTIFDAPTFDVDESDASRLVGPTKKFAWQPGILTSCFLNDLNPTTSGVSFDYSRTATSIPFSWLTFVFSVNNVNVAFIVVGFAFLGCTQFSRARKDASLDYYEQTTECEVTSPTDITKGGSDEE